MLNKDGLYRVVLAVSAAVLALLSMPGYLWGGLILIALVPLLFALENCSWRQGFLAGYLSGFCFFAFLLYWVYTLADWAGIFIVFGHLALAGILGLWWGIFGAGFSCIRHLRTSWLAVPALWVLLEYLRSLTRFGFTWGFMSDALYQHPALVQIASLTGAWGLSFVIVCVNFFVYRALRERRVLWGVLAGVFVIVNWGWGFYQLRTGVAVGQPVRVAIVHSNVDQHARSDPGQLSALQNLYLSQIEKLPAGTVDLVLLPESVLPAFLLRQPEILAPYAEAARRLQAPLIVGTIDYRDGKLFNTSALLNSEGIIADLYDKVQLVPFSTEYFPLIDIVRNMGIENLIGPLPLGALTPGEEFRPLQSQLGRLATPICFESIFPQIGRAFVRHGAQALLIITNDAWFKGSPALEQHFAKAVFRAVETGRFTVQAANGGISGIIDPQGRVLTQTRSRKELVLQGQIALQDSMTLYAQLGDWFVYLIGLLSLALWRIKC